MTESSMNTFFRCFGGHVQDPTTMVVGPSTLSLTEYLCRGKDVRSYTVEHRANYTGNVIRREEFRCDSYMGGPGNWCGARESARARSIFWDWYREAWQSKKEECRANL
jgi:hypothetical protein